MRKTCVLGSSLVLLLTACISQPVDPQTVALGKRVAFERKKGNCLACHAIEDGEQPGNLGQPLTAIQSRFNDKQALRAIIWDATQFNAETSMPPFGRNNILSAAEIDAVVEYLWSLP